MTSSSTISEKSSPTAITKFNPAQGAWAETSGALQGIAGIYLYNAAGLPVAAAADRDTALTSVLTNYDGFTVHFDLIWKQDGEAWGRPTAILDRHGNALEIEYLNPHFNTLANPVSTAGPYFRKSFIRDAYGKEAALIYIQTDGKYVVSRIDLPNGQHLAYQHGTLSNITDARGINIWME